MQGQQEPRTWLRVLPSFVCILLFNCVAMSQAQLVSAICCAVAHLDRWHATW
jgi:hypothetical protein